MRLRMRRPTDDGHPLWNVIRWFSHEAFFFINETTTMALFLAKAAQAKGVFHLKRPLLDMSRAEVTFLTTVEGLPISVDSSNRLGGSSRSQIRHLLIPLIDDLGFSSFEDQFSTDELAGTRTQNNSVKSRKL